MKIALPYCRVFMQASMILLAAVGLWGVLEVFRGDTLQRAVATRVETRHALGRLEAEAQKLEQLVDRWAVGGAMSFEIQQTITGVMRDAAFPAAVVVGSHRLHTATLQLPEEPAEDAFAKLHALQGLPVRIQKMDITVDDHGRVRGTVDVAWLERL